MPSAPNCRALWPCVPCDVASRARARLTAKGEHRPMYLAQESSRAPVFPSPPPWRDAPSLSPCSSTSPLDDNPSHWPQCAVARLEASSRALLSPCWTPLPSATFTYTPLTSSLSLLSLLILCFFLLSNSLTRLRSKLLSSST